jgi:hypothetical protein
MKNHEDEARSLIRVLVDATHLLQNQKGDTLATIKKHCTESLRIQNDKERECFYETQAASLEAETLSGLEAVRNVFAVALKRNPEIAEFNPRGSGVCTICGN